jgi:hypothetical protein
MLLPLLVGMQSPQTLDPPEKAAAHFQANTGCS